MKVEVKKINKIKRTIKIEVSGEEFKQEKDSAYKECAKSLKVPGFRSGTAPLDILEKHHSKILKEEFLRKALPLFYQKALDEKKMVPAGLPNVYGIEINQESMVFSADLEVRPEIDIQEDAYKGIKIKDKKAEVQELEIEKVITNLKEGVKKATGRDLADDELARWASFPEMSGLRETIRAQLFIEKSRERRQFIDNQMRKYLVKSFKTDLPAGEVERHLKELLDREVYNLRLRGISDKDIEKYKKDLEEKLKPLAEEDVKLFYILEAIARKEGLRDGNNLADKVLGYVLSQAVYI